MGWFSRQKAPIANNGEKKMRVPEGLWTKCKSCNATVYTKELEKNLNVCPHCGHHFRISAKTRLELVLDNDTFTEFDRDLHSIDFLDFQDSKSYRERILSAMAKGTGKEAVICGEGMIDGAPVQIAVFDFTFMGGSMGSVVGEKITRLIERAKERRTPAVIFSSSGGARMQESIISLMQMAKTSAALARLRDAGLPYISVLTDPTTGGVTASFAMLGDVIVAEPKALIGFAGPRVIEQTIRQKLPEGFQRAEYLLEHGMVDVITPRKELKATLSRIVKMLFRPLPDRP